MQHISGIVSYALFKIYDEKEKKIKTYHIFGDNHKKLHDCTNVFEHIPYNYVDSKLSCIDNGSNISDFSFVLAKMLETSEKTTVFVEWPVQPIIKFKTCTTRKYLKYFLRFSDEDIPMNSKNIHQNNILIQTIWLTHFKNVDGKVQQIDTPFSFENNKFKTIPIDYRRYNLTNIKESLCSQLLTICCSNINRVINLLKKMISDDHDYMRDYLLNCLNDSDQLEHDYKSTLTKIKEILKDEIEFSRVSNFCMTYSKLSCTMQERIHKYFCKYYDEWVDGVKKVLSKREHDLGDEVMLKLYLKNCLLIEMDTFALCKILSTSNDNNIIVAGYAHCIQYIKFFKNYLNVDPQINLRSDIYYNTKSHCVVNRHEMYKTRPKNRVPVKIVSYVNLFSYF